MANLNSPFRLRLCAGIAIALGSLSPHTSARAQSSDGHDLLLEIVEAINFVSVETAREAHAKCLSISKKLADRKDIAEIRRLYNEAMISKCISYAMNNGQYSELDGRPMQPRVCLCHQVEPGGENGGRQTRVRRSAARVQKQP